MSNKKRNIREPEKLTNAQIFLKIQEAKEYTIRYNITIISLSACVVAIVTYLAVSSFAGKTTQTNVDVKVALKDIVFIGAIVMAVGYGIRERWLRKKTIASFSDLKKAYEELFDPNRSSSMLTKDGNSNPED